MAGRCLEALENHVPKMVNLPLIQKTRFKIYISCHTLKELLQYPHISTQEESRINNLLPALCTILPTTKKVALIAGHLTRRSAEYRDYHIEDCYIAATAITYSIHHIQLNCL